MAPPTQEKDPSRNESPAIHGLAFVTAWMTCWRLNWVKMTMTAMTRRSRARKLRRLNLDRVTWSVVSTDSGGARDRRWVRRSDMIWRFHPGRAWVCEGIATIWIKGIRAMRVSFPQDSIAILTASSTPSDAAIRLRSWTLSRAMLAEELAPSLFSQPAITARPSLSVARVFGVMRRWVYPRLLALARKSMS